MIEITGTAPEVLTEAARRFGAKTAVLCERREQTASFAELNQLADLVAAALRAHGVGGGDRVGVMFRNDLEFPVSWLGILRAGATMVPLNVRLTAHDLTSQLRATRPALVLAADEFVDVLRGAVDHHTQVRLFDTGSRGIEALREQLTALAEGASPDTTGSAPRPESLANIQFTSGSTGLSKGCLLSHRYWVTLGEAMRWHGPKLRHDDVLLTAQPFYYMDPQWNLVAALLTGAKLVVLERFRSSTFWSSVQRHQATFFYCLGVMPSMLLSTPPTGDENISAVRYIACSAIPEGRHAELEERFGAPWYETYGSTETGADILVEEEDHDAALATGALGRPLPHREIRIVGEDGSVLPRGTVGRLLVRGTGMSDGYLDERHTASSTVGNGWYVTGDLAMWAPDGMVHFAGREKDIIRRAGENVSAAQVEQAVESHPGVRLCACVPVADEIRGEEIKAYVVVAHKGELSLDDLLRHTRERLASFKVPRYWEFRTSLPHTPSEKIAKGELRREPSHELGRCYDAVREIWLDAVPALPMP
ncbi:AMP-binding protein [Streptosporangium canum]|uniref:AMP-binding protein n=1 Tax=Streptosporangium canum TaxID=324952 RepID=UPI003435CD0F